MTSLHSSLERFHLGPSQKKTARDGLTNVRRTHRARRGGLRALAAASLIAALVFPSGAVISAAPTNADATSVVAQRGNNGNGNNGNSQGNGGESRGNAGNNGNSGNNGNNGNSHGNGGSQGNPNNGNNGNNGNGGENRGNSGNSQGNGNNGNRGNSTEVRGAQATATATPVKEEGNAGTIKISSDPNLDEKANEPKPGCQFYILGFGFKNTSTNSGSYTIYSHPQGSFTLSGSYPASNARVVQSSQKDRYDFIIGPFTNVPTGQYKVELNSDNTPGGAKQKVFKVECATQVAGVQVTPTATPTATPTKVPDTVTVEKTALDATSVTEEHVRGKQVTYNILIRRSGEMSKSATVKLQDTLASCPSFATIESVAITDDGFTAGVGQDLVNPGNLRETVTVDQCSVTVLGNDKVGTGNNYHVKVRINPSVPASAIPATLVNTAEVTVTLPNGTTTTSTSVSTLPVNIPEVAGVQVGGPSGGEQVSGENESDNEGEDTGSSSEETTSNESSSEETGSNAASPQQTSPAASQSVETTAAAPAAPVEVAGAQVAAPAPVVAPVPSVEVCAINAEGGRAILTVTPADMTQLINEGLMMASPEECAEALVAGEAETREELPAEAPMQVCNIDIETGERVLMTLQPSEVAAMIAAGQVMANAEDCQPIAEEVVDVAGVMLSAAPEALPVSQLPVTGEYVEDEE